MQERNIQLSRDNLMSFLDFVAEKGLMKRDTAIGYKKACSVVLRILDENEAADLSRINLDNVFARHRNLAAGRILPATLRSYESRTRAAINNFIEYSKDPTSWKPGIQQRPSRTKTKAPAPPTKKQEPSGLIREPEIKVPSEPSIHIDFQIHISPETTPEQIDQVFASMRRHLYGNK